ncbi:MAG TPA: right-handed parallel beta-helix repeat-containing protein [Rudaea sp.]|nr:right-handed parallel beta-helix repeat-containing protein [Rudaea sp.]
MTTDSGRWRWVAFLGATVASLAGNVLPAFATTYVVDTTADVPTPTKTTLRQAVFQANGSANNIVQFDPSLNGSTITLTQGEVAINQPMYIVGPGANKLTVSGNDASRIFNISTASATPIAVMLSGLTMSHGKAAGNLGGAIYASNVSLTVQDSVLDYNTAQEGGAICAHSGNAVASASKLTRATVTKNNATGLGAGIAVLGGASLQISASTISANTSIGSAGAYLKDVGAVSVDTSQITGNHATVISGGGLLIDHYAGGLTNVTVSNSGISGNVAGTNGGGVALFNVSAVLTGDTISGNSADSGGGVFVQDTTFPYAVTEITLQQSSVSGNTAARFGGGIDVRRTYGFSVDRSLISANSVYDPAAGGGGIAIEYAKNPTYVTNSTIYGNYAYNNGGGVGIFSSSGQTQFGGDTITNNFTFNYGSNGILGAGSTNLYDSVVANNFSHAGNQDLAGVFGEIYSLVRNVGTALVVGNHNKNGQDPLLGPLAVNGGPTLTMMPALSSPVLDAGGPSLSGTDQRGLPRSANGRRDIGAVERQYPEDVIFRNGFDSS